MINRPEIKRQSKQSMFRAKPSVFLVTLVLVLVNNLIGNLGMNSVLGMKPTAYLELVLEGMEPAIEPSFVALLIYAALMIMSIILGFGYNYYCLKVSRDQKAGFGELLDGFGIFLKVIGLNIVMGIFIWLWSLLLIIPGIIAAYRYSMAFFVLMDNPELSVMDCIRRSKELTSGHKKELFVLDLSFIGWNLLTSLGYIGMAISLFVNPYYMITQANYYNRLSGWSPDIQADYVVME